MRILYYSPSSYGGIADYAHEQANALVKIGADVDFLCTPDYPSRREAKYTRLNCLKEMKLTSSTSNKLIKAAHYIRIILGNYRQLASIIQKHSYKHVLLGAYAEYLAPLWSYQFRKLARQGTTFGAVIHDPIRDFVLGPLWWHRWSIASAYSFLDKAFTHEAVNLDTASSKRQIETTVIPHGIYGLPSINKSRGSMRSDLGLPPPATVILAFGHIRANKNINLAIEAMVNVPDVYLIVAGKAQSSSQKLVEHYQSLAKSFGVADRCRWQIGFIPEQEAANLFEMSDLVLLTYSQTFRSASGVLSMAACSRKICLVSSGEGPLKTAIKDHPVGLWIEPDSVAAISDGLKTLIHKEELSFDWTDYLQANSWDQNAKAVLGAFKGSQCALNQSIKQETTV